MRRTLTLALILCVFVLTGVFAGGSTDKSEGPVELTVWIDSGWGSAQETWVDFIIADYEKNNPETTVEAVLIANIYDATRTALASGAGPDVVMTYGPFALELGKAGLLYPLGEFVKKFAWNAHFAEWALGLYEFGGDTVALPDEIETLLLYYNKTLFESRGWEPPATIDELINLSQAIEDEGIIPFGHSNPCWRGTNEWFVGEFINHYAGPAAVYDAIAGKRSFGDSVFVESMEILANMQKKGWFSGGLDRYYTTPCETAGAMFGSGEAAMRISGTWSIGGFGDQFGAEAGNNNDWGWVPMPSRNGEAIFDVGIGNALAINNKTKNPEAVARFLDYYYSSEVQGRLFTQRGKAPAPVNVKAEHLEGAEERYIEVLLKMNQAFADNNYGYTTWTFFGPKTNNYMIEEVEKLWAGDITAQQYMDGWQKLHAEELDEGTVPPSPER